LIAGRVTNGDQDNTKKNFPGSSPAHTCRSETGPAPAQCPGNNKRIQQRIDFRQAAIRPDQIRPIPQGTEKIDFNDSLIIFLLQTL